MWIDTSQVTPNSAISSDPVATPEGSAAQLGRPLTRDEKPASRPSSDERPLRWPCSRYSRTAVVIVAKPVAIATWSIGAPPAGGELAAMSMDPPVSAVQSHGYVPVTYTTVTSEVTLLSRLARGAALDRAHERPREVHDPLDRELLGLRQDQPRAVLGHLHQQPGEQL